MLAVVLQLAAMPLANSHMLQRAIDRAGAITVTICTPMGSEELQLDAEGKPLKTSIIAWVHCAVCFVGGSSPLITGSPVTALAYQPVTLAAWQDVSASAPQGAGNLWPWSHGPPA